MSVADSSDGRLPIGEFNPDPERHEGFSFIDQNDGCGHEISALKPDPENPGMLAGMHILKDEKGDYWSGPHHVAIEASRIRSGRELTVFVKEHSGKIAVSGAIGAVVTLGTLFVRHKHKQHNG